nr:MAG TPA: hypothetical protein [Caudoviricetes sp.]
MPNNHHDYDLSVCEVTRATYMAMLNEFRTINPGLRDRVDDPPVEDDNITYLALVGKAKVLQESRKALGTTHLERFDGKLRETYEKQGFVTVARSLFNREYAPETWNYDAEGEPDYLVMALPGSPTHKHYTSN